MNRKAIFIVLFLSFMGIPVVLLANAALTGNVSSLFDMKTILTYVVAPGIGGVFSLLLARIKSGIDIFKVEIKGKFDLLNQTFENTVGQLAGDINTIKISHEGLSRDVNYLKKSVNEMKVAEVAAKEFEKQLMLITDDWVAMFDDNPCLKEFALCKASKFDDYVMWVRSFDFSGSPEDINFEMLKEKGVLLAENVRQEGKRLLGITFMNLFYAKHHESLVLWFENIEDIIKGNVNNKKHGFQIACLQFKRQFMSLIWKTYVKHGKTIYKEDANTLES